MTDQDKYPFEDFEVISQYTTEQAIDDGILVALDTKNIVTRTVFDFLTEAAPKGPKPPDHWAVELMGWFRAKDDTDEGRMQKAVALARGLIGTYEHEAKRIYEENANGGIWAGAVRLDRDLDSGIETIVALHPGSKTAGDAKVVKVLWLIPNELGGLTLMFPEDY